MNYTPRKVFEDFHTASWRRAVIVASRRSGKEQPVSEPVLTLTGFVPMGQIKPGSLVIGMDGKPHKVLAVFPQGVKPIYKIKFSDGSYTRAGLEHLWRVYKNFRANKNAKTVVLSTTDLLKDYKKPHPYGGYTHIYCLPQQEIINFNKKNTLPLHPYVLGVLLGDGSFYSKTPCVANPIPEIRQKLIDFGYDPADIKIYGDNGTPHYNIRGIHQIIKDMGLRGQCYNNKFVPEEYLFASPEDRLLLLQGLMDTDGYVSEDGKSSFSNCNNNLIEAVCWLARSLGMIATVSTTVDYRTKSAPCKNVSINSQVCPFLAEPNKLKRWKPSRNCRTRRIVDISYDGEEEAQCILVDSEDHTYLTRDFIITHNTFASVAELLKRAYNGPQDGQYLFISPLAEQSMANTIGMFARFDNGEGYITKVDKTSGVLSLANGAQITLGGARTAEKYRGRYLDGCFSGDTEVLTNCGWIRFDEAINNTEIKYAQFDQDTGIISFDYPTKRFEFEDREVMEVDFGVKCGKIICTPNHQWLVKDSRSANWKKVDTSALNGHHSIPRAALNYDETQRLTPQQRLAIAVQADAHIASRAKDTYSYRIAFNKERKIIRFIHILKDCGINARAVLQKSGYTAFYFTLPKSLNITKRLCTYFDLETVPACDFIQEIAEWDGSRFNNDGIYYSSTVKENRDFVQAVAILAGYRTAATKQVDNRKESYSDVYRLFCTTNSFPMGGITKGKKILEKHQTVYCVEVPKHNIVVRTMRGNAVITSNCIADEISQVPPEIIAEVILPCLADRNGWLAFLGTARTDDDYRLYKLYKEYKDDPGWFARMISIYDNPEAFPPERIKEIHDEHTKFCLASGMSMTQAEQTFNVEFECDFSFIDEGRPNMTALFYPELQALFDAKPPRLLEPTDTAVVNIPPSTKTAVFDISHSAGRDYTVATIVAETTTTPIVTNIIWENNQPLQYWFDYLRQQGIRNVALPFDAATVNKETMLSLVQTFKREGFNVVRIKRLLREEQVENGRWLLNNARFSKDCVPGLSQIGLFQEFSTRHGLPQDVVASLLYAGQVLRKKHVKIEVANSIRTRYNNNMDLYDNHVSYYGDIITGE